MGNQLFKYAAAYALAKRLDADIWLQGTYRQFFDVKKHKRSFVLDQYKHRLFIDGYPSTISFY